MNRKSSLLLFFCLILTTTVSVRADDVDDWVRSQMQVRHIPAVSIAVIKDGRLVKAEGYGTADMEHATPARVDTVFKIGSTSKHMPELMPAYLKRWPATEQK